MSNENKDEEMTITELQELMNENEKFLLNEIQKMKNVGDYIIKGVDGEYYPIKKDIFAKTYEIVTEGLI